MLATVRNTMATRLPPLRGQRVLVAISGGADSVALTLALHHLGVKLVLAHVNHGIRGRAAAADARFVAALARRLALPLVTGKFSVPQERHPGESLEMAARRIRRDFLLQTARRRNLRLIATGHTADDQAETILLRIARGTSVAGLAGIRHVAPHGPITFIRPLRDTTRRQVETFLRQQNQRWREDATNTDAFALRNRVRHEILPLLAARLNPNIRAALLRLGAIAAAEDDLMADLARRAPPTAQTPLALRRRQALAALHRAGVDPATVDFATVDDFSTAWKNPDAFSTAWKKSSSRMGGIFHSVEKSPPARPVAAKKSPAFPPCGKKVHPAWAGFSTVWKNSGTFSTAWKTIFHTVENSAPPHALRLRYGRGFTRRLDDVCLSAAAVGGRNLIFRNWRAGDRMQPLGMTGSKKLSDIFTDLKVPREQRAAWVVVECDGEIAALAGWRVARPFAVPGPRAPALHFRFQPMMPRARSSK